MYYVIRGYYNKYSVVLRNQNIIFFRISEETLILYLDRPVQIQKIAIVLYYVCISYALHILIPYWLQT